MTTYATINDARAGAKSVSGARCVVGIIHSSNGQCYIVSKAPLANLRRVLAANPLPEILSTLAEYPLLTDSETAAMRAESLRHSHCERCHSVIDGNTAYHQSERWGRWQVTAFYCEACRSLLSAIGAGEHTALQERAQ